jgi:hypothetical protein
VASLGAEREQRRMAEDDCETLRVVEATVGVPPVALSCIEVMQQQITDLQARVAMLEARPDENEDGQPRSSGLWCRTKEAMRLSGYSRAGLRKLRQQNRVVFDFSGPHCLYDVTSIVRKRVRKVPA